ncbi:MAG TPA: hypothetical protein VFA80_04120, partial [Xanthobacteraceae bacterium]|nr:hypothetical protein [Xanthobacteraceae bacterium]
VKDVLAQINADSAKLLHGRSLPCGAPATTLWHSDAVGVGPSTSSRVFDRRRRRFAPLTKQSSRNFLLPLRLTARSDQKRERGVHRAPFAFVVPHD